MSKATTSTSTRGGGKAAMPQLHPPAGHLQGVFSSPAIVSNSASGSSVGSPHDPKAATQSSSSSSMTSSASASASNAAAATGASLVTKWESSAKLSQSISLRLANAAKLASERAIPEKFFKVDAPVLQVGQLSLDEEIENMQQFYEWFGKLEELVGNEQEEEYRECLTRLQEYLQSCELLLERMDGALTYLKNLDTQYRLVSTKTGEVHQACEELLNEQRRHVSYADNIQNKLTYFNEVDSLGAKLNNPTLSVYDEAFSSILKRLDQCVTFISQNPTFQESETYLLKFRQLQSKGLTLIKNKIIAELRRETNQVLTQLKPTSNSTSQDGTPTTSSKESVENALFNVKFRAIALRLRPLCRELEARNPIKELAVLVSDVQSCYFQQRQLLLNTNIYSKLQTMITKATVKLDDAIRMGCLYLIDVCNLEYALYHQFFTLPSPGLRATLEGFCRLLYDSFRPIFIREHRMEELCNIVNILKTEILHEQLNRKGESVSAFKPIVNRMIEDAQERLVFLAMTYIRDEISTYVPTEADLNYPQKLVLSKQSVAPSVYPFEVQAMESTWYPTLRRTILCLSKLYQNVDTKILEGLAQEAVSECTYTLVRASKLVAKSKSMLDGQLFLIMHLLILREQIAPFDIDFRIVEKSLDFSQMRAAISKMLTGQSSIWKEGGLFGFVAPRVKDYQLDSKKALENQLREAIEQCISSIIQHIMSKLISFITAANSWLNVNKPKEGQPAALLRDQAFAQPAKVKVIVDEAKQLLREYLPLTVSKIRAYLSSPSNEHNFNNIMNTLKENISQYVGQIDSLVASSYLPEDAVMIGVDPNGQTLLSLEDIFNDTTPLTLSGSNIMSSSSASSVLSVAPSLVTGAALPTSVSTPVIPNEPITSTTITPTSTPPTTQANGSGKEIIV